MFYEEKYPLQQSGVAGPCTSFESEREARARAREKASERERESERARERTRKREPEPERARESRRKRARETGGSQECWGRSTSLARAEVYTPHTDMIHPYPSPRILHTTSHDPQSGPKESSASSSLAVQTEGWDALPPLRGPRLPLCEERPPAARSY